MTRDQIAEMLLIAVAEREALIAATPRPPAWQPFACGEHDVAAAFGPRYSPSWLGAAAATDARRTRTLRVLRRLADAGLLSLTVGDAGRLARVRLTLAGRDAVAAIQARQTAAQLAEAPAAEQPAAECVTDAAETPDDALPLIVTAPRPEEIP